MDLDDMVKSNIFRDELRREDIPKFPRLLFLRRVARESYFDSGMHIRLVTLFGQSAVFNYHLFCQTHRIYPRQSTRYYLGNKGKSGTRILIGKVGDDEYFVLAPTRPKNDQELKERWHR